MRVLVLGGGVFLGAAVVDSALAAGHDVTVFNRGRSRREWPSGVEALVGDRRGDLAPLRGRRFDAVVDTCGYVPADVRAGIAALQSACERYCFVSSVSAYASFAEARESDPLAPADGIADDDRDLAHYGPQKAACEQAITAAFGARTLVVRPGLIVGPRDPTGRFSHWPWRALAGGDILVPDVPVETPLQWIDVRDLADWIVHALASGRAGAYNAVGPQDGSTGNWQALLEGCIDASRRCGAAPLRFVPVGEAFLLAQGVAPWSELPLWLASSDPAARDFARIDAARAVGAGLVTRPLAETIEAVLDEAPGLLDDDPRRRGKLTRPRESALIAAWLDAAAAQRGALAVVRGERR